MSSGTPQNPGAARAMLGGLADQVIPQDALARTGGMGLSPRQQVCEGLWRYYRCQSYDTRKVDWAGDEVVGGRDHDVIATSGALPAGFVNPGSDLPLKFRRPTAPYYLARIIVDRFTGLLFSQRRHPKVRIEGDEVTEDFLNALIESGRLWAQMIQARTFGGAMGSVGLGFSLINGKPVFETFDARHCVPAFVDRTTQELESLEVRYMYQDDLRDQITGQWVEAWFWYRRVIDQQRDTVWPKVPVGEGDEPKWAHYKKREAVHGLGECPVVWIQNLPVQDTVDGDPDCHGTYDMIEAIDALVAQAHRGIISNCDPTLVISSPDEMDAFSKGSGNALKISTGTASYLEIDGKGPDAAIQLADGLEQRVLKQARCVLDSEASQGTKTATEVEHDNSSMWEKADVLREQYGEKGVKRLLEKALRLCRLMQQGQVDQQTGLRVIGEVVLPPRVQKDGTRVSYVERALGDTPELPISLQWPGYAPPSADDAGKAVSAASEAILAGILDKEHGAKYVAPYFQVEDVGAMLKRIADEAEEQALAEEEATYSQMEVPVETEEPVGEGEVREDGLTPSEALEKFFAYEIEDGIVTINEVRHSKGLGPLPSGDGDLTVPQYKAKHPEVYRVQALVDGGKDPEAPEPPPMPKGALPGAFGGAPPAGGKAAPPKGAQGQGGAPAAPKGKADKALSPTARKLTEEE